MVFWFKSNYLGDGPVPDALPPTTNIWANQTRKASNIPTWFATLDPAFPLSSFAAMTISNESPVRVLAAVSSKAFAFGCATANHSTRQSNWPRGETTKKWTNWWATFTEKTTRRPDFLMTPWRQGLFFLIFFKKKIKF